jgi:uncharacterized protein YndB with AHSA1/START domain
MGKQFEIVREGDLPGTPEQVWDAITTGMAGWLWPTEIEPRLGGDAGFGGVITVWEPNHHLVVRQEGENGWFNQLENVIEARDGGTTWARYVHSGVFTDDWENQYDGADKHTDFYRHTLAQYLRHFTGRPATYTAADGPPAAGAPDALDTLARALGAGDAAQDERVRVTLPGIGTADAVVDYRNRYFLGVRTDDALYRFFGRNHFGHVVGLAVHHFGQTDQTELEKAWQTWIDGVYA